MIDTACASCLHSKKWRESYQRTLPPGALCTPTNASKLFHFADGKSSQGRLTVWRVPIFFGGVPGEVYSAEISAGTTPLLLSIPCMQALDMIILVRKQEVSPRTPPDHWHGNDSCQTFGSGSRLQPRPCSEAAARPPDPERRRRDGLHTEEARFHLLCQQSVPTLPTTGSRPRAAQLPDLGPRGVSSSDKVGELNQRRVQALLRAERAHYSRDLRSQAALRREYSMAEQWASNGFRNTFVFEPFGGAFGVTRAASEEYSSTCSQPIDWLDGYDLLTKAGRDMVRNVVRKRRPYLTVIAFDCRIWSILANLNPDHDWTALRRTVGKRMLHFMSWLAKEVHQSGRYYLIENPATSTAWSFEGVLPRVVQQAGGSFACGDQCRYGAKDIESGRPIRKERDGCPTTRSSSTMSAGNAGVPLERTSPSSEATQAAGDLNKQQLIRGHFAGSSARECWKACAWIMASLWLTFVVAMWQRELSQSATGTRPPVTLTRTSKSPSRTPGA